MIKAKTSRCVTPEYDLDGNQTKILTKTDEWKVSYDDYKRLILFIQERAQLQIRFQYDIMGRQIRKTVTKREVIIKHENYLYKAYLRIMGFNRLIGKGEPLYKIFWDPSEPIATKPLAIEIAGELYYYAHDNSKNTTLYTYSHDLTKNVTELYSPDGTIDSSYDYSPYGAVTVTGTEQPIQWSSECYDPELSLSYYNYRHYNPTDGRWLNRDPIGENGGVNLYTFVQNRPILETDYLGDMVNAATNITMPNTVKEKNFQALINNIKKQVKEQKLCCLPELTMAIHGNPTFAIMGDGRDSPDNNRSKDPAKANYLNENNIGALFSSLSSQVTFCSPCLIYFLSCNIGLGRLPQIISDSTQCSVRAPMGYCFPNISKPANRKVAPSIPGYPTYPNSKPSFGEFSPSHQSK